ncbi:MAG TPA: response regulator transcription factor [Solirubrobacteraceae bacterium]|jgi:two-component system response regulator MprA|nr:response regulator transcription factor [Solirubrobacteraceae bacterium]
MQPKILIVEDDAALRGVLIRSLRAEGLQVEAVASGHELLQRAAGARPQALVIDIGLPDADGRDVCQVLRTRGCYAPVLFLTARDALTDRLSGFRSGGDDYVTKPFDIEEVAARIWALIRRSSGSAATSIAGLEFDPTQLTISCGGSTQSLTPTEFRLLAALAGQVGKAISRSELISIAWPHGAIVHDNTLDVYVARLRRKLRAFSKAPSITTVHGLGYRLQ